jgi:hypothetical protein
MARPRGVVAWAVIRAVLRVGRATHRKVHGLLRDAAQLGNIGRCAGVGSAVQRTIHAATADVVARVLRTLAHYGHLAPVGDERVPGARRPLRIYGLPGQELPRADLCPLVQVMSIWGAPARS